MNARAQESLEVFRSLFKPTMLILLWMSLLRGLLFTAVFSRQIGFHPDIPAAFFAGFRFDLLVLGFCWIPILVFTWFWAIVGSPKKIFFLWKLYLALVTLFIFDMSWLDLLWAAARNGRLNHEFFVESRQVVLDSGWVALGRARALIFLSAMSASSLGIVLHLYWISFRSFRGTISRKATIFWSLMALLMVAFAARGTWTPHHLNLEHAQVSDDSLVNQIPLNAVWNMDK